MKIPAMAVKATRKGDVSVLIRSYNDGMADVVFVLIIVGFFALAALFVKACDLMIGADEDSK